MLYLVAPSPSHFDDIDELMAAFKQRGIEPHGVCGRDHYGSTREWWGSREYVKRGAECYVLYDDGLQRVVGICRLSRELTAELVETGSYNVGYCVHPDLWGKGYGTALLQLLYNQAWCTGMNKLLMEPANAASERAMVKSGATLSHVVDETKVYVMNLTDVLNEDFE